MFNFLTAGRSLDSELCFAIRDHFALSESISALPGESCTKEITCCTDRRSLHYGIKSWNWQDTLCTRNEHFALPGETWTKKIKFCTGGESRTKTIHVCTARRAFYWGTEVLYCQTCCTEEINFCTDTNIPHSGNQFLLRQKNLPLRKPIPALPGESCTKKINSCTSERTLY